MGASVHAPEPRPAIAGLMWDTSGLLNLVATGHAAEILASLGCLSYVVDRVRTTEVIYIRPLPEKDPTGALIPVDLAPLLESNALYEVALTADELMTFVAFATDVDDGEARTAAAAQHRGLWMATDDRIALRLCGAQTPPIPTLTTPEWVKRWAESAGVSDGDLGQVLRRIEVCAHYTPRRVHPLKAWWDRHLLTES